MAKMCSGGSCMHRRGSSALPSFQYGRCMDKDAYHGYSKLVDCVQGIDEPVTPWHVLLDRNTLHCNPIDYHIMNSLQLVHHAGSCIGHCRATRLEMDHFCFEPSNSHTEATTPSVEPKQEDMQLMKQIEGWRRCCTAISQTGNEGGK